MHSANTDLSVDSTVNLPCNSVLVDVYDLIIPRPFNIPVKPLHGLVLSAAGGSHLISGSIGGKGIIHSLTLATTSQLLYGYVLHTQCLQLNTCRLNYAKYFYFNIIHTQFSISESKECLAGLYNWSVHCNRQNYPVTRLN